ncbi:hypothetical protein AaE_002949, partial [Aphanomyces astaci]
YRQYYFFVGAHVMDGLIVVLWLGIWCTRLHYVTTASYSLMVQLAGPTYVSLRGTTYYLVVLNPRKYSIQHTQFKVLNPKVLNPKVLTVDHPTTDVTYLAQQDRVLFAFVSLVMWLNWTRYLSSHHLRYLLCVLEATWGYIVGYILLIVVLVMGVTQYLILASPWSTQSTYFDHFTKAVNAMSTHGMPRPAESTWSGYVLFFGFNVLLPLYLFVRVRSPWL